MCRFCFPFSLFFRYRWKKTDEKKRGNFYKFAIVIKAALGDRHPRDVARKNSVMPSREIGSIYNRISNIADQRATPSHFCFFALLLRNSPRTEGGGGGDQKDWVRALSSHAEANKYKKMGDIGARGV